MCVCVLQLACAESSIGPRLHGQQIEEMDLAEAGIVGTSRISNTMPHVTVPLPPLCSPRVALLSSSVIVWFCSFISNTARFSLPGANMSDETMNGAACRSISASLEAKSPSAC